MVPLLDFTPRRRQLLLLAVSTLLLASSVHAQIERTGRDGWQKVDEIFAAMGVSEGSRVADVGAGGGFLTVRLSEAVGEQGTVYAEDVNEQSMRQLTQQVEDLALRNVEPILGTTDDPRLPVGELDAVVIVNAYHEMGEYEAMLSGIWRSLRPGGRLVIVDNPPRDSTASRGSQMRAHDIHIGVVEQDLRTAGFEILERRPDFIDTGSGRGQHQQWMLVAAKPDS
ncbi:MAG: class I SAM-dependent methyltransferase [Gemmatimonadota bacterium]|nr:MAG: class I SAM-dependent methyltransferase [Gemmatimonadota bacterium]